MAAIINLSAGFIVIGIELIAINNLPSAHNPDGEFDEFNDFPFCETICYQPE